MDDIFKENGQETAFQHYRILVIAALVGMFCASMEAMVAATLMPSVMASLGGFKLYPWIADSYLLASVIATPIFGKLVDRHGFPKIYTLAVILFLLGSGLSGAAQTMKQLIAFRAVQGAGSAGLITLCVALFGIIFPVEKRAKMQSLVAGTWAISSIIGPTVGAIAVEYFTWRWAFYVNVPIALGLLAAVYATDRLPRNHHRPHAFDLWGICLFTPGAVCTMLVLLSAGQLRFGIVQGIELSIAVITLALFARHAYCAHDPIVPLRLLHITAIGMAVLLAFLSGILLFGTINFQPLFIQGVLGLPAWEAGRIVTVVALGTFGGSLFSGYFLNHIGFRNLAISGALSMMIGLFMMHSAMSHTDVWRLVMANFFIGGGLSAIANASVIAAQAVAPKRQMGSTSSLFYFFRMLGGTTGIAMLGGVQLGLFHREVPTFDNPQHLFNPLERGAMVQEQLLPAVNALQSSLQAVLLTCIVVGCVIFVASFFMPASTPKNLQEKARTKT